jgi:uracil-DNA glycosylase
MVPSKDSKQKALLGLAHEIDANQNWWRFPEEAPIRGFLGTSSIIIVGDQPSTSSWQESHPNRRAFYDTLKKVELSDAHLTDLYKKRGRAGTLRKSPLPSDFNDHLLFFQREIEILQPSHIVALGKLAYDLIFSHLKVLRPVLVGRMWHFSFVVRSGLLHKYEANMRRAIWRTQT